MPLLLDQVLLHLREHEEASLADLCETLKMSESALGLALSSLALGGMLRHRDDHRKGDRFYRLTRKGLEFIDELQAKA